MLSSGSWKVCYICLLYCIVLIPFVSLVSFITFIRGLGLEIRQDGLNPFRPHCYDTVAIQNHSVLTNA